MNAILRQTIAPLLSLFIFSLGNGLFMTLTSVRLEIEGAAPFIIGLATSAYFLGLVIGSIRIEPLIIRIGHIRAFSAFVSMLAVIFILQGIFVYPLLWLLLRFFAGLATVGIFIVIESWLLIKTPMNLRGRILAFYLISYFGSQALGQLLLKVNNLSTLLPFSIAAMLCSLSVIPLATVWVAHPIFEKTSRMSLRKLFRSSKSGVSGCFIAGLMIGALYGLLPLYVSENSQGTTDIALIMFIAILGGMCLQYPVGHSSDLTDRRTVLAIICAIGLLTTIAIPFLFHSMIITLLLVFLFGGLAFTIYPISVSYVCDGLDSEDIVAGSQSLLFTYSFGATIGPTIASLFMRYFPNKGLFIYFSSVLLIGSLIFLRQLLFVKAPSQETSFIAVPQTTPVISTLDPRSEEEPSP